MKRSTLSALAFVIVLCGALIAGRAQATDLSIEDGRWIEGLWVYPSLSRPGDWRYVPADAILSRDANGDPAFSMTLFVNDTEAGDAGAGGVAEAGSIDTIVKADGGALVHLLVEYRTDPDSDEARNRCSRSTRHAASSPPSC